MGQKYFFELRRCSSYGVSSHRELLMKVYSDIFTVPEESLELRRGSSNRKSSYRESTVNVLFLRSMFRDVIICISNRINIFWDFGKHITDINIELKQS